MSRNRIREQAYREAHRDEANAYAKTYREKNKVRHREKNREYNQAYRKINAAQIKAKRKAYRQANKDKIKAAHKLYKKDNRDKFRGYDRKREALKLNNRQAPYNEIDIFERDGWICQICGQKINKRLKYPNPRSGSIDHIVPVSKGGADAPINVQATHLRCNVGKNAGNGGQLRLIG